MESKLAYYRRKSKLTQDQLAELSGVTTRTIQRIENGAVVPHVQTLKLLADSLKIEIDQLTDAAEGALSVAVTNIKPPSLIPLYPVLALIGLFMPVLNVLLPFVLWVVKKEEHTMLDLEGRKIINFQITMSLLFPFIILLLLFYFPLGFVLLILVFAYDLIISIVNLWRAIKLVPAKYPLSIKFLK